MTTATATASIPRISSSSSLKSDTSNAASVVATGNKLISPISNTGTTNTTVTTSAVNTIPSIDKKTSSSSTVVPTHTASLSPISAGPLFGSSSPAQLFSSAAHPQLQKVPPTISSSTTSKIQQQQPTTTISHTTDITPAPIIHSTVSMVTETVTTTAPVAATDSATVAFPTAIITPTTTTMAVCSESCPRFKRTSSGSNDTIYERDRYRARVKVLNNPDDSTNEKCQECESTSNQPDLDFIKTTRLNMDSESPLVSSSIFYKSLAHYSYDTFAFPVKTITLEQLKFIFMWYFNSPLPKTSKMFPWLHGLNPENFAQKSFFLFQQQQLYDRLGESGGEGEDVFNELNYLSRPKHIRFLMCITNDNPNLINLKNTVGISEILHKIDVSKLEIKNIIQKTIPIEFCDNEELIDLLVNDCVKLKVLPIFKNLDPDRGISLRNFHIQVAKLSTCSDFIIYGNTNVESMARILWLAQRNETKVDQADGLGSTGEEYNVFILNEDLTELLGTSDDFIFSDDGIQIPGVKSPLAKQHNLKSLIANVDFPALEKIETSKMSSATKLHQNVWAGNQWDWLSTTTSSHSQHHNKVTSRPQPSEMKNLYNNPDHSHVITHPDLDSSSTTYPLVSNWNLFIHCHADAKFPSMATLSQLLFTYSITSHDRTSESERHVLSVPPSGSLGIGDCKSETLESLVNTCKLIYLYSSSTSDSALSCLIYCSDGYTESSLFVLCYLMYCLNLSLADAMLKLHLDYGRPFYIFSSDVAILKKLEPILRKFSPVVKKNMNWGSVETISSADLNDLLLGKKGTGGSPSSICSKTGKDKLKLGYIENSDDDDDNIVEDQEDSSATSSDEDGSSSNYDSDLNDLDGGSGGGADMSDWVDEVEGSIPSKILPYLYLGSLKHASCVTLLNKLGIKKIISVGETVPWLNGYKFRQHNDIKVTELDDGNLEIFEIAPRPDPPPPSQHHHHHTHHGRTKPRRHHTSVTTVMKVNNLEDDGIDELTLALPHVLDFINQEYQSTNGQTKILVHCRVGVSRSATVVIAEVMKRLMVNLSIAYLYVRVRRLNIIIQPNLRFMYELFKWEEQVKMKQLTIGEGKFIDGTHYLRDIDWFIMCREIMRLNVPYLNN
ncbi:PPS1 [[Candida] subhashii]|uniref:PPS1 n=1 Tax=[Candida] subhashii TaxID=561895 RepID=A0A8J5UWV9_9ASCO|nr:PPS1 [[Candida] subhashii]KAG7663305.1 PPS1 [[Candida] subhashii]